MAASEHIWLFSFATNFIGDENAIDIFVLNSPEMQPIKQKECFNG